MNYNNRNQATMEVNGIKCILNLPKVVKRVKNADGSEGTAGLPPWAPRNAYPVDEYPATPDTWMHGSGDSSSYFVPIKAEHGMWLDFTCNGSHTHHIAAVVSVQGINPVTGMKADPMRLEQYRNQCPKHDIEFKQDRYCEKCKYKWPAQNYLCSNSNSSFWLDGFRTEDGTVRQYYFTEEECKGVAAQVIGKERVYAIGVAFYLSKDPKPKPNYHNYFSSYGAGGGMMYGSMCTNVLDSFSDYGLESLSWNSAPGRTGSATRGLRSKGIREAKREVESKQKMLEIGAGAKIQQRIGADPESLDFWQPEPAGLIYINYCDEETAERIIAAGKREDHQDGFLQGLELRDN